MKYVKDIVTCRNYWLYKFYTLYPYRLGNLKVNKEKREYQQNDVFSGPNPTKDRVASP